MSFASCEMSGWIESHIGMNARLEAKRSLGDDDWLDEWRWKRNFARLKTKIEGCRFLGLSLVFRYVFRYVLFEELRVAWCLQWVETLTSNGLCTH